MITQIRRALVKIFLGRNYFLRSIILKEYKKRNYFKAAAMTILTAPFRSVIKQGNNPRIKESIYSINQNFYNELHKLLHIAKTENFDLVRIGRDNDGGYIMLDDFKPGGIAYSFGISNDVSFDKDMAARGYDVFMYDHTIEKLPEENNKFHFFRQGIADGTTQDERLKTLEYFITQNNHENKRDMILKMDVEGAEWGFLESVKPETLAKFSQLTFEFHDMSNPSKHEKILSALRKINATHQLIHLHANNNGFYISMGDKNFPDVIELTYILRDKYKFVSDYDVNLPLSLDMLNNTDYPEIILGRWNENINFGDKIKIVSPYIDTQIL